jgi:hypothetical protein
VVLAGVAPSLAQQERGVVAQPITKMPHRNCYGLGLAAPEEIACQECQPLCRVGVCCLGSAWLRLGYLHLPIMERQNEGFLVVISA